MSCHLRDFSQCTTWAALRGGPAVLFCFFFLFPVLVFFQSASVLRRPCLSEVSDDHHSAARLLSCRVKNPSERDLLVPRGTGTEVRYGTGWVGCCPLQAGREKGVASGHPCVNFLDLESSKENGRAITRKKMNYFLAGKVPPSLLLASPPWCGQRFPTSVCLVPPPCWTLTPDRVHTGYTACETHAGPLRPQRNTASGPHPL